MSDQIKELTLIIKEPTSQKNVYNTLLRVHSTIVNNKEDLKYFVDNDGLNAITQCLSQPNEKLLNISLGILAEGCLDTDCSNRIVSEGIVKKVINILRYINQDRIHYRCCKVIGNLASHINFCSVLISNLTFELMIPILKGQPSISTQFTVFRSLRYMWIGATPKEKKLFVESDIFENTFRYLESEDKNVQKSVLRLLLYVSRFRSNYFLKQLIKRDVLPKFVSITPEHPSKIFRIFYYLCEIRFLHFELAKAGVVEVLLSHLHQFNSCELEIRKEADMDLVLRSLHRLCSEPKCRERLCCIPDAFDTLLGIIENSSFNKFKKYSVLILTSFMYDGRSLKKLVKKRLILAVISYLQTVIEDQGVPHGKDETKNEANILLSSPNSSGRFSPVSDSEMSFAFSASPNSERFPLSPASSLNSVYSPICSPIADGVDEEDTEDIEELSADECSSVAESPLAFQENDSVKSLAEEKIFNLLKQLSFGQEPINDLCAQRTWDTLLDYLVLVRRTPNHLTCLLSSIAANKYYFQQLLQMQFPLTVHKKLCRPVHIDCDHCLEMNKFGNEILTRYQEVAESTYGHEVLRNEITKGNTAENKILLALTIPHIVKNVSRLEEYLLRYKTFQLIMESFNEEVDNNGLFKEKVAYLYSLANDVYLENRRTVSSLCKRCDVGSLTKEATISFLLDDGSTVTANKRTICEKSEFFEGMFRCGFKEAKESVVRLSNISSDCLTVLFRLLYSYCDCIIPKNVVILLELIVQSDRFLIPNLSKQLLNITMNCMLDYKNCHIIYDWAIENGSFLPSTNQWPIRHDVVRYALAEKVAFNKRVHSLRMLLKSKYKSNVLADINQIIECQLKCKDIKTKSSLKYIKETAAKRHKTC